ncbi:pimeloyl-ACP methyl ester carboxylesterase [Azospirillum agricola]|uniref:alpha/beta fold hydrolase n=1 Tax=Azospirillum agricola TaxID=1720247 RepID=UPI001AE96062|nr:alpha/beta hydrolase [Azospirillum agricola]MBP2227742.1 pimeloyl-ACP methyl ester carboxylesterase [Azospirillum agricola]
MPKPHYVTTASGQLRLWREGSGPDLLVLPGLIMAASVRAGDLARRLPGWTVTVVELPGIGGSANAWADGVDGLAALVAEAATTAGIGPCALLAFDLTAPLAVALVDALAIPPAAVLLANADAAEAWAERGLQPPPLAPRADGTHLAVLCAHLRDAHILDPRDPRRPSLTGDPLPDAAGLDATVVAAAVKPERYAALWASCAGAMPRRARTGGSAPQRTGLEEIPALLAAVRAKLPAGRPLPPTQPFAAQPFTTRPFAEPAAVWHDHADTPKGRVHLRRAGPGDASGGTPLLAFQSAPGSSAPLLPLIRGLAGGREVIAPDYLGNGDSDKPERTVDIETLAEDALAVADALGLARFDLWGTHTGALVALELTVRHPERVGRVVLEAPVLIPPGFNADILDNYFPPLRPDRWGLHLLQAWNMRRDMFLFWPWYRQERAAGRALGVPTPEVLHDWVVGLLKSGAHYDRSYRAAFRYDTRAALPRLTRPTLICAGPTDMLVEGLAEARELAPAGTVVTGTPATVWYPDQEDTAMAETLGAYDAFLRG